MLAIITSSSALAADKLTPTTQPAQVLALINKADLPAPAAKGEPVTWPTDKADLATKALVKELKGKTRSFRLPVAGPINKAGHWGTFSQPIQVNVGGTVLRFSVDFEFPELSPALKGLDHGQMLTIEGPVSGVRAGNYSVSGKSAAGVFLQLDDCRIIAK